MRRSSVGPPAEDEKSLYKRYLFWLYKTTREALDRTDRKFTQLVVDRRIERRLRRALGSLRPGRRKALLSFLREWEAYVAQKQSDALHAKFDGDGQIQGEYIFLYLKLRAITEEVRKHFGVSGLKEIKRLYEEASLRRISEDQSGQR